MALIKCKKCGQPVSDKADFCSVCGAPVCENSTLDNNEINSVTNDSKPKKNQRKIVAIITAVVLLFVGIYFIIGYVSESMRIAQEQEKAEQIRREIEEQARVVREQFGISSSQKVDLGLSVYWGGWNVGANFTEESGDYYAWGETETKSVYSKSSYEYYDGEYIYIGSEISTTLYDAAYLQWGGNWRMPTGDECRELVGSCTWTWITCNGVNGYKVTGPNGNSIFLPTTGCCLGSGYSSYSGDNSFGSYWSGTLSNSYDSNGGNCAYFLSFHSNAVNIYDKYRIYGHTIRPVCDK